METPRPLFYFYISKYKYFSVEITLYILLVVVSLFFTYLTYSKNTEKTIGNQFLAGLLWFATAFNSFTTVYLIPLANDYVRLTDNSKYYQQELGLLFGIIGLSMWLQIIYDNFFDKSE